MVNHQTTSSITSLPTTQIHLIHITQMMLYQINQHPNLVHTSDSSQNNNPNLIGYTPHIAHYTNATSKIPSTHEESLSSIPSSCFHVHPNETTLLAQQDNLTITLTNKPPHPSYSFLPNDHFENHTQSQDNNHHSHQIHESYASCPNLNTKP